MADSKNTDWIGTFATYLSSALDPVSRTKLKQEYIQWVKTRGNYYSNLKQVAPEFLELLNVIEKAIAVEVKIEGEAEDKEVDKSPEKEVKEPAAKKESKPKDEPKDKTKEK